MQVHACPHMQKVTKHLKNIFVLFIKYLEICILKGTKLEGSISSYLKFFRA